MNCGNGRLQILKPSGKVFGIILKLNRIVPIKRYALLDLCQTANGSQVQL